MGRGRAATRRDEDRIREHEFPIHVKLPSWPQLRPLTCKHRLVDEEDEGLKGEVV